MPDRSYTAEEVDAAVSALADPGRFAHAQEVVTHAAPGLRRVLDAAMHEGGWFGDAREGEVARAIADGEDAIRGMLDEEARLGMLVGVAVGFELARELQRNDEKD